MSKTYSIQVVIPFKDQKELTLKAVRSVLNQKGVEIVITAVDNNSQDLSIGEEIQALGGEVITISEPFNFSRLNNLAVKKSTAAKDCELLFFMNNDVELEPEALFEMCCWIDQPLVGTVGCRLNYPDGRLQCGGVDINSNWPRHLSGWDILEKKRPFDTLSLQKVLRVSDGVNGASMLIKKKLFLDVGGFDEVWYPVAHSDTNFSAKINHQGLYNFYTPYACGIHHETVSREVNSMEDFENTAWLENKYFALKPYNQRSPI